MTKKEVGEIYKTFKEKLKKAEDVLEFSEGTRVSSCSMSYEVGYWQGMVDLVEQLFLKGKK
jgi:hypothetical protein